MRYSSFSITNYEYNSSAVIPNVAERVKRVERSEESLLLQHQDPSTPFHSAQGDGHSVERLNSYLRITIL